MVRALPGPELVSGALQQAELLQELRGEAGMKEAGEVA